MQSVGFTTGKLGADDLGAAVTILTRSSATAIELSALREHELPALMQVADSLDLSQFQSVSVHLPSRLEHIAERELAQYALDLASKGWPVILHADAMADPAVWRPLGGDLCIENMDSRKATGRTAAELAEIMERVPDASLCFDAGHARQMDRTMSIAEEILRAFTPRIRLIHLSEVRADGGHAPLTLANALSFMRISHLVPKDIPIILESPVQEADMEAEIELARRFVANPPAAMPMVG